MYIYMTCDKIFGSIILICLMMRKENENSHVLLCTAHSHISMDHPLENKPKY
jgi:hypothetical protein